MRHNKAGVKLNRTGSHRNAMFRNMVTSLFKHERITTTEAKAKELRRWADKMITLAKRGDLHARRQVLSIMREKAVVHKLFDEAQARFGKRDGGYTRIVKMGFRPGDAASMTLIELIDKVEEKPKKAKKKAKAEKSKASAPAETAPKKAEPVEPVVEAKEVEPSVDKAPKKEAKKKDEADEADEADGA